MNEWQPIETAPKDGTMLLLFGPFVGPFVPDGGTYMSIGAWTNYGGGFWDWNGDDSQPTHWMFLPDPPQGALQAQLQSLEQRYTALKAGVRQIEQRWRMNEPESASPNWHAQRAAVVRCANELSALLADPPTEAPQGFSSGTVKRGDE